MGLRWPRPSSSGRPGDGGASVVVIEVVVGGTTGELGGEGMVQVVSGVKGIVVSTAVCATGGEGLVITGTVVSLGVSGEVVMVGSDRIGVGGKSHSSSAASG